MKTLKMLFMKTFKILLLLLVITVLVSIFDRPVSQHAEASYTPPVAIPASYGQWVKITKAYTDFSTAGLTSTITIATLPAKTVVTATVMNPSTPFTGGIISAYSISVGMSSTVDLMPASSTLTTPTRPWASSLIVSSPTGSTQTVTATAISVTGLLNAATAGSVDIWLYESTLP